MLMLYGTYKIEIFNNNNLIKECHIRTVIKLLNSSIKNMNHLILYYAAAKSETSFSQFFKQFLLACIKREGMWDIWECNTTWGRWLFRHPTPWPTSVCRIPTIHRRQCLHCLYRLRAGFINLDFRRAQSHEKKIDSSLFNCNDFM